MAETNTTNRNIVVPKNIVVPTSITSNWNIVVPRNIVVSSSIDTKGTLQFLTPHLAEVAWQTIEATHGRQEILCVTTTDKEMLCSAHNNFSLPRKIPSRWVVAPRAQVDY